MWGCMYIFSDKMRVEYPRFMHPILLSIFISFSHLFCLGNEKEKKKKEKMSKKMCACFTLMILFNQYEAWIVACPPYPCLNSVQCKLPDSNVLSDIVDVWNCFKPDLIKLKFDCRLASVQEQRTAPNVHEKGPLIKRYWIKSMESEPNQSDLSKHTWI